MRGEIQFDMSWQEVDQLLRKLFDSEFQKERIKSSDKDTKVAISTPQFQAWVDQHIQESHDVEIFYAKLMICLYCQKKITDDKFVVLDHPEYSNDRLRQIYFHSKGDCNPRHRVLEYTGKKWLREYNYACKLKSRKKKAGIIVKLKEKIP